MAVRRLFLLSVLAGVLLMVAWPGAALARFKYEIRLSDGAKIVTSGYSEDEAFLYYFDEGEVAKVSRSRVNSIHVMDIQDKSVESTAETVNADRAKEREKCAEKKTLCEKWCDETYLLSGRYKEGLYPRAYYKCKEVCREISDTCRQNADR